MKLAAILAASANAATLFSPIYEQIAQTMVSQASGMLQMIKTLDAPIDVANNAALVGAIDAFDTALNGMDNAALVSMIQNLDVTALIDADGNLDASALVTVFSELDPATVQDLQTAFVAAVPADAMSQLNASMDAFIDLGTVFQDIMNNNIELSNFAAIYNDFADAVVGLDSVFGNNVLGSTTNALLAYSSVVTTLAEKALVVWESYDDIRISFRNADTLVQFGIEDRLNEINHVDGQSYLCTMGENGIFDTAKEAVEFIPDVLITNFRGPTMNMVSLYNDFIHGIEIGSFDLSRYELNEADLDAAFTMIDNISGSIAGTLVEVKTLALPFSGQINAAITNSFC